jgi:hypothetical protein
MADQPITVSRDALRADLAEMELRLRTYFDVQLVQKASAADVVLLQSQASAFARGEFTEAQLRSIDARVEETSAEQGSRAWSKREQMFAVMSSIATAGALALSTHGRCWLS